MIYSLKEPQIKPVLNKFNALCFKFFLFIIIFILAMAIFIEFKEQIASTESQTAKSNSEQVKMQSAKIAQELAAAKERATLVNDIKASNLNLRKSINNLFDLVPDSIVLKSVKMQKHSLKIQGITPTKQIYENLLQTPLISIFESSKTNFYQDKNGWYNFSSYSEINNSEGFNE